MRLLLDTHVLVWALADPGRLTDGTREALADGRNAVFVSAASVWEVAIKRMTGKLRAPDDLLTTLVATGFSTLPISAEHAMAAGELPLHHRDPFDRMLVAQAAIEGLQLVTDDERMARYGVAVLDA